MAGTAAAFLDRLADGIAHALAHALDADDFARRDGLLQRLDPRVKLGVVVGFIVVAVVVKSLAVLAGLFLLAVALALASRHRARPPGAAGVDRRPRLHRADRAARRLPGAGRRHRHAAAPRLAGDAAGRAQRRLPHRPLRDDGDLRAASHPVDAVAASPQGAAGLPPAGGGGRHPRHDLPLRLRLPHHRGADVRGAAQPHGRPPVARARGGGWRRRPPARCSARRST